LVFSGPLVFLDESDPPQAVSADTASVTRAVAYVQRRIFMELLERDAR
jgi:hypothetical protein